MAGKNDLLKGLLLGGLGTYGAMKGQARMRRLLHKPTLPELVQTNVEKVTGMPLANVATYGTGAVLLGLVLQSLMRRHRELKEHQLETMK